MMKASEILAEARDAIAAGWTQGTVENAHGSVCAVGALRKAMMNHQEATNPKNMDEFIVAMEAGSVAGEFLKDLALEFGAHSVINYNDATGRTHEEVLNWFDKGIIQLEEKGL
jgi:hypothetical protein